MDEISTSLDSLTTFQIVNSIKHSIHILHGNAVDHCCNRYQNLMIYSMIGFFFANSYIVYQGPRKSVSEFFEPMGFKCLEGKGVSYFLQEVTLKKDQKQSLAHRDHLDGSDNNDISAN